MKEEDFFFNIQIQKPMHFLYKDEEYCIKCDKDSNGNQIILFGRTFQEQKYSSYGEFMNTAKVENTFFKHMLEDLDL